MFFEAALVICVIQLLVAWACFALSRGNAFSLAAAFVLGGIDVLLIALTGVAPLLQGFALLLLGVVCLARAARPRTFMLSSALLSVTVFLAVGVAGMSDYSAVRDKYPLVSLAPRLQYETKVSTSHFAQPAANLSPDDLARFDAWYDDETQSFQDFTSHYRANSLKMVHDSQVEQFINSPGFGVGRGMRPSTRYIDLDPRPSLPISNTSPPPVDRITDDPGQSPLPSPLPEQTLPSFEKMHRTSLADFVNSRGFGYVRDRDHVAGFEPHAFRHPVAESVVNPFEKWLVSRLELVSLLKHAQPAVYVSDHLPNMEELRNVSTRPLDKFEQRSLQLLTTDNRHLAAESTANRIRMLGAVRATKRCLACHSVEPGALLGAFSYELIHDPQLPEFPPPPKPANPAF